MTTWSIVPTSAVLDTVNAGIINVTMTATNSVTGNVVVEVAGRAGAAWTIEAEKAYRQDMLYRLQQQDTLKAAATAYLPSIEAYIAGNPAPVAG